MAVCCAADVQIAWILPLDVRQPLHHRQRVQLCINASAACTSSRPRLNVAAVCRAELDTVVGNLAAGV